MPNSKYAVRIFSDLLEADWRVGSATERRLLELGWRAAIDLAECCGEMTMT